MPNSDEFQRLVQRARARLLARAQARDRMNRWVDEFLTIRRTTEERAPMPTTAPGATFTLNMTLPPRTRAAPVEDGSQEHPFRDGWEGPQHWRTWTDFVRYASSSFATSMRVHPVSGVRWIDLHWRDAYPYLREIAYDLHFNRGWQADIGGIGWPCWREGEPCVVFARAPGRYLHRGQRWALKVQSRHHLIVSRMLLKQKRSQRTVDGSPWHTLPSYTDAVRYAAMLMNRHGFKTVDIEPENVATLPKEEQKFRRMDYATLFTECGRHL